jgi:hypothetical protein
MSISECDLPLAPFNPSYRRDDGRGCPSPGLARLPKVRDATPEERFEKARWTLISWAPYRGRSFDDIARDDEGLLFLDSVRRVSIPRNQRLAGLWEPLRDFLTWPTVAEALQAAKDRAAYGVAFSSATVARIIERDASVPTA